MSIESIGISSPNEEDEIKFNILIGNYGAEAKIELLRVLDNSESTIDNSEGTLDNSCNKKIK